MWSQYIGFLTLLTVDYSNGKMFGVCMRSKGLNSQNGKISGKCNDTLESKIIGGRKASPSEFPHMAQLGYMSRSQPVFGCGASIISKRYLLTAAHCLLGPKGHPLVAVIGTGTLFTEVSINIAEEILYPEYDPVRRFHHDIALLRLERPISEYTDYIRPACLQIERHIGEKQATATGWGNTSFRGRLSPDLLKVTLPILSNAMCNNIFWRQGFDKNIMLCAGEIDSDENTCHGDSGGPLQIKKGCMYNIIGIVAFGNGMCTQGTVFTRVSYYIEWIESIVWPLNGQVTRRLKRAKKTTKLRLNYNGVSKRNPFPTIRFTSVKSS